MKSCYEIITTILTQNGKTQPNNMNANEPNTNEQSQNERIAYSIPEVADMLGVDYFSVYRLVQRGKLKACRALRGKFLITRAELARLLNTE
jgi:excisionase family DNA binding protein